MKFYSVEFSHPWFLLLLLLTPVIAFWIYKIRFQKPISIVFNTPSNSFATKEYWWYWGLDYLKLFAFIFLVIALAGPQKLGINLKTQESYGVDIVMAMDVSGSMLAKDLKPNRFEALRTVATEFVEKRINDRIGLVLYAGESYARTPLTADKTIVMNAINEINFGEMMDGTAIGMGLATAINRLKTSTSKSKIVILLTDGVNNAGAIDPKLATELAKGLGIKVYTIGIGTNGMAPMPYATNQFGEILYKNSVVEIDENLLKSIAKQTNGKYYRATSNNKLSAIYNDIDRLEKSTSETFQYNQKEALFRFFVLLALICWISPFVLKKTLFKSLV